MNPFALLSFAKYLMDEMGDRGDYDLGQPVGNIELIAPFWVQENNIKWQRDRINGMMLANDAKITRYNRKGFADVVMHYEHDVILSLFIRSEKALPLEGRFYIIPFVLEHLTKNIPESITDEGIDAIVLTNARFSPSNSDKERNLLILQASFTVTGFVSLNIFNQAMSRQIHQVSLIVTPEGTTDSSSEPPNVYVE